MVRREALSTHVLARLLSCFIGHRSQVKVLGVFPANLIPSARAIRHTLHEHEACCFIANTDPHTLPGQHWVAFFIKPNPRAKNNFSVEFFDSYGMPMHIYEYLYAACQRKCYFSNIKHTNTLMLQHINSPVCGHYCVLFLYLRSCNSNGNSFASTLRFIANSGTNQTRRDNAIVFNIRSLSCRLRSSSSSNSRGLINVSTRGNQCCCARSNFQ
jgi:hypothetical protein